MSHYIATKEESILIFKPQNNDNQAREKTANEKLAPEDGLIGPPSKTNCIARRRPLIGLLRLLLLS